MNNDDFYFDPVNKVWLTDVSMYRRKAKIAHGLYTLENGRNRLFWQGEELKLWWPSEIEINGHRGFASGLEFDAQTGAFVPYQDQEGEDVGYYDLIEEDIRRY